jgi:hypothetical protein
MTEGVTIRRRSPGLNANALSPLQILRLLSGSSGLAGFVIPVLAGIRIGYWQAKSGRALRASGIARFAVAGPVGFGSGFAPECAARGAPRRRRCLQPSGLGRIHGRVGVGLTHRFGNYRRFGSCIAITTRRG